MATARKKTASRNTLAGSFVQDCMHHYQFRSWSIGTAAYNSKQHLAELWQQTYPPSLLLFLFFFFASLNCVHKTQSLSSCLVDHLSFINMCSVLHAVMACALCVKTFYLAAEHTLFVMFSLQLVAPQESRNQLFLQFDAESD